MTASLEPSDETYQLAERFLRVLRSLDRLTKIKPDQHIEQLNLNQLRTLIQIRNYPGISQKDIAEKLEITPASVSIAIRQMEEINLVERIADSDDGRIMRLYLGAFGKKIVRETETAQIATVANLLTPLNSEEQRMLIELLEIALKHSQIDPPAS